MTLNLYKQNNDLKGNYILRVINILTEQIFSGNKTDGFKKLIDSFHTEVSKMKETLFVDLGFVKFLQVFSIIHSVLSTRDID